MSHYLQNTTPVTSDKGITPWGLQKLNVVDTAKAVGLTPKELFALRGRGRISYNFFQFDKYEKDWQLKNYCYRGDIPQLRDEIVKAEPSLARSLMPVEEQLFVKKEHPDMNDKVTFIQIGQALGLVSYQVSNIYRFRKDLWPSQFSHIATLGRTKRPKFYFDKEVIEALRERLANGKQLTSPTTKISLREIAERLEYNENTIKLRYERGHWPKEFSAEIVLAPSRNGLRRSHIRVFDPAVIPALKKFWQINPNGTLKRNHHLRVAGGVVSPINNVQVPEMTQPEATSTVTALVNEAKAAHPMGVLGYALELIKEGHETAGVYLIKKYG